MPAGSRIRGIDGVIELTDGTPTTEEIPMLQEWELQVEANLETEEGVFMASNGDGGAAAGADWNSSYVVGKSWTLTTTHKWQKDNTVGTTAIAGPTNIGDEVTVKLYPTGNNAGGTDKELSGTAIISSVGVPSSAGGEIEQQLTLTGTGPLAEVVIP